MDSPEESAIAPRPAKPRTITVLGLFVAAAGLISYLATYAFTDALVKAEFLSHWQPEHDPRPKRFVIGFICVLALFVTIASVMKLLGRHDATDNEMDESEDPSA